MIHDDGGFGRRMEQVERLIEKAEGFSDPNARAVTRDIVAALLELHGAALGRMLEILNESGHAGRTAVAGLADDGLVSSLLLLHDLHPVDFATRVHRALDSVRPALGGHGGGVELLGVDDGVIRLRLEGNCNGCPSSGATLRGLVETALDEAVPDRAGLEVEGNESSVVVDPHAGMIPLMMSGA